MHIHVHIISRVLWTVADPTFWTEDVLISGVVLYTNMVFGTDECVLLPYFMFQGVLNRGGMTERCELLIICNTMCTALSVRIGKVLKIFYMRVSEIPTC